MLKCELLSGIGGLDCFHNSEGRCSTCPLAMITIEENHPLSNGEIVESAFNFDGDDLVSTDTYMEAGKVLVDYTQTVRKGTYKSVSVVRKS